MTSEGQRIILTTAPSSSHAAQIIYGLNLRGIHAEIMKSAGREHDPYSIMLIKGDVSLARSAIEVIWDAMLESTPRATDMHGACYFCGYDIRGLVTPVVCPECGKNLDSIESRREAAEGRISH
jgi:hypothetical protein